MKPLLISVLASVLLASLPARATPLEDRISELKHAIQKEAAARANGGGGNAQFGNQVVMNPAFVEASIDQILTQMQNPACGNMDAQIAQITSMYTSTEVQEATTNLLNEIKKERKEKVDAEITAVKALITRAGAAITSAKKPEDLDDLIAEIGRHANNQYGGNSALQGDQELVRRLNSANEFVKQWQNYMAHMANGQTDQARNDLQNLSNNNGGEGLLPRSKLLELEAPDKLIAQQGTKPAPPVSGPVAQAQAILDGMKTLDDIKPALAKLEPLRQGDMQALQNVYNQLNQIEANYEDLKAGLPTQTNLNRNLDGINVPAAIRSQFLLFTLQARFDSYKGPPPAPGEKPTDYIDRVIADATTRQDWNLLRLADVTRANLSPNMNMGYSANYGGGVESIVAAAHLEAAGQFSLAVQAYETALKSDNPAIPARIIGDKLAAIQRDHPKEYADGVQLMLNPPAPRYLPYPSRLPGQPFPSPAPGAVNPLNAAAPVAPPVPVPATNPAPAPAAPPAK